MLSQHTVSHTTVHAASSSVPRKPQAVARYARSMKCNMLVYTYQIISHCQGPRASAVHMKLLDHRIYDHRTMRVQANHSTVISDTDTARAVPSCAGATLPPSSQGTM
jgi:hypothetical protein